MWLTNYINGEFGQSCGHSRADGSCTSKDVTQYGVTEKVEKINDFLPTGLREFHISFRFLHDQIIKF